MAYQTADRIIPVAMVGWNKYSGKKLEKEVRKKQKNDWETYFLSPAINRFDIELFGKKIGRKYFEEIDKSELLGDEVFVVGHAEMKSAAEEYSQGLSKNYVFIEFEGNRYKKGHIVQKKIQKHGMFALMGVDLPQAASIDDYILQHGELKAINLAIGRLENMNGFWRNPVEIYNDSVETYEKNENGIYVSKGIRPGKMAFKEPQIYLMRTPDVSLERLANTDLSTKLNNPLDFAKSVGGLLKLLGPALLKPKTYPGLKEAVKSKIAHSGFNPSSDEYHITYGMPGKASKLKELGAIAFRVKPEEVNLVENNFPEHNKDTDTVEDLFRHAKEIWNKEHPDKPLDFMDFISEEHKNSITYNGTPILEVPEIKEYISWLGNGTEGDGRAEFFRRLKHKEIAMLKFSRKESNLSKN